MAGDRYQDILAMSPMVIGSRNTDRLAVDKDGQLWISVKGAAYVRVTYEVGAFAVTPAGFTLTDWRSYWQQFLGYKTGAITQRWCCPWSSDFVGQLDYAQGLGGGTNTDTAGITAPGVRVMTCTGATGGAFVNISDPGSAGLIPDIRLSRWGIVARLRLPTATPDANTRITFGVASVGPNANYGVGSVGAISTSFLTSINGGSAVAFPAGSALSSKAADPNNFVWIYVYNDLQNVWFSVDGETDKLVCSTSTIAAGLGGYVKVGNFPAGGVRVETCELDAMAVFTER